MAPGRARVLLPAACAVSLGRAATASAWPASFTGSCATNRLAKVTTTPSASTAPSARPSRTARETADARRTAPAHATSIAVAIGTKMRNSSAEAHVPTFDERPDQRRQYPGHVQPRRPGRRERAAALRPQHHHAETTCAALPPASATGRTRRNAHGQQQHAQHAHGDHRPARQRFRACSSQLLQDRRWAERSPVSVLDARCCRRTTAPACRG